MIARSQVELGVSDSLEDRFVKSDQTEVHLLLPPPDSGLMGIFGRIVWSTAAESVSGLGGDEIPPVADQDGFVFIEEDITSGAEDPLLFGRVEEVAHEVGHLGGLRVAHVPSG